MEIAADEARQRLPELTYLLVDAVDGGGANGFLRPLAPSDAAVYWDGRLGDVEAGRSILVGSMAGNGSLTGSSSSASPVNRTVTPRRSDEAHGSIRRRAARGSERGCSPKWKTSHVSGAADCLCSTRFRGATPSGCIAATAGSRSG